MTRKRQFARPRSALKFATLLSVCGSIAACSVADPLVVRSTVGVPTPSITQIAMAMPEGPSDAPIGQMATALTSAFEMRGMNINPDGNLIADYALAVTPATIGVQRVPNADQGTIWISPARESQRFDECEAMELRGTLLLIDRGTGNVAFRSKARTIDCEFDAAAITALADGLVADFVANSQI